MPDREMGLQRRERLVEQVGKVGARADALGHTAHGSEQVPPAGRHRQRRRRHRLDRSHRIDVGAQQPEHAGHARMRRDAGEVRLHPLEQRSVDLGALVVERQSVAGDRQRVDRLRHRTARGEHVLARLVEELVRQRDVRVVDVEHLRHQRDVRCAVGCARGDGCGNRTVEAASYVVDRERAHRGIGAPAFGPGVWTNALSGAKSTATSSPSRCANNISICFRW
jgi:hypothetical protein